MNRHHAAPRAKPRLRISLLALSLLSAFAAHAQTFNELDALRQREERERLEQDILRQMEEQQQRQQQATPAPPTTPAPTTRTRAALSLA